jgi:hypothetical protein
MSTLRSTTILLIAAAAAAAFDGLLLPPVFTPISALLWHLYTVMQVVGDTSIYAKTACTQHSCIVLEYLN